MPDHEVAGGEIWLHPDEAIAKVIDMRLPGFIGLVTTRASGLHYASVLKLTDRAGYRFAVPQWEFCEIERSISDSKAGAEEVICKYQMGAE